MLTAEVKHYEVLTKADRPVHHDALFKNDDFVKHYCDTNLRTRIKKLGLDPNSLVSKNSQGSLKSDISGKDGSSSSSEGSGEEYKLKEGFWGALDFNSEDERLDTSHSTLHPKGEGDNSDSNSQNSSNKDEVPDGIRNILQSGMEATLVEAGKKKKAKKEQKIKRRRKNHDRIKVLGVDPVDKQDKTGKKNKITLDQFGHLEDSETNLQNAGFGHVLDYMNKMGMEISYQKETHGRLKSNLKPRVGAQKRGLNVKFDLKGLAVKDENTAKKLKESGGKKEDPSVSASTVSIIETEDSNQQRRNIHKRGSIAILREKPKEDPEDQDNDYIDSFDKMKKFVMKKYSNLKKAGPSSNKTNSTSAGDETGSAGKKRRGSRSNMGVTDLTASYIERDRGEVNEERDSDEEIRQLRKIAKKKVQVVEKEEAKIAELVAQQAVASDFRKPKTGPTKDFFVEIIRKDVKRDTSEDILADEDGEKELMAQLATRYEEVLGKKPLPSQQRKARANNGTGRREHKEIS